MSLTSEVHRLIQMHQGDVSFFSLSVVTRADDDAIDYSGLYIRRYRNTLRVETEEGQPALEVGGLPVETKKCLLQKVQTLKTSH